MTRSRVPVDPTNIPQGYKTNRAIREKLLDIYRGPELDHAARAYGRQIKALSVKDNRDGVYFKGRDGESLLFNSIAGKIADLRNKGGKSGSRNNSHQYQLVQMGGSWRVSGKSGRSDRLADYLSRRDSSNVGYVLNMDQYGFPRDSMKHPGDIDHPLNMDWARINSVIREFKRGKLVARDGRVANVLVLEGLHALTPFVKEPGIRVMNFVGTGEQAGAGISRDAEFDAQRNRQHLLPSPERRLGYSAFIDPFSRIGAPLIHTVDFIHQRPFELSEVKDILDHRRIKRNPARLAYYLRECIRMNDPEIRNYALDLAKEKGLDIWGGYKQAAFDFGPDLVIAPKEKQLELDFNRPLRRSSRGPRRLGS